MEEHFRGGDCAEEGKETLQNELDAALQVVGGAAAAAAAGSGGSGCHCVPDSDAGVSFKDYKARHRSLCAHL